MKLCDLEMQLSDVIGLVWEGSSNLKSHNGLIYSCKQSMKTFDNTLKWKFNLRTEYEED